MWIKMWWIGYVINRIFLNTYFSYYICFLYFIYIILYRIYQISGKIWMIKKNVSEKSF